MRIYIRNTASQKTINFFDGAQSIPRVGERIQVSGWVWKVLDVCWDFEGWPRLYVDVWVEKA